MKQVPPGSAWERQGAESMVYGMIYAMFFSFGDLLKDQFNYLGVQAHPVESPMPTVVYDGVTISMASGDYKVTVEQVKVNG